MVKRSVTRVRLGNGITRIVIDMPDDSADIAWAGIEGRVEAIVDDAIGDSGRSRRDVIDQRGGIAAVNEPTPSSTSPPTPDPPMSTVDCDRDRRAGYLHLTLEADTDQPEGTEPLVTLNGWALANPVARRWLCDIDGSVMVENRLGVPVAEGSRQRIVPRAMRRRLSRRDDHTCRFPHCEVAHNLHAHHITHWVHGGETSLDNLVMLCPYHHRLVHEGGWTITGHPNNQLSFSAPRGEHTTHSPETTTDPGAIPRRHRRNGRQPELICRWDGTRPIYADLAAHIRRYDN